MRDSIHEKRRDTHNITSEETHGNGYDSQRNHIRDEKIRERHEYVTAMRARKKKSNYAIMAASVAVCLLFLGMIVYFSTYSVSHEEELINNSFNSRQQLLVEQNRRGSILSRDGDVLARTVENEAGKDVREYPYQNLFSHTVGYTGNGKYGIEAQANYDLLQAHITTTEKIQNDINGDKNPADNVITTLDLELQQAASDAMGMYKGAIVVTNPKTGEILAMVSKPDFDPETIAEKWDEYVNDSQSGVLLNRATQGLYPPGSTCKIVTTLEYIRENPDSYMNYSYTCKGKLVHGDDTISCYHGSVHNAVDLTKSFAKSCNTSFANIGLTFDRTSYKNTAEQLLFNSELPVQFLYGKSNMSIDENTPDSDLMQNAIGQGKTLVSPFHLNLITQAVANDGILMKPYLISQVISADNEIIKDFKPEEYGALMTETESGILKSLMREVVLTGTAKKFNDASYTVAGKTGSAEFNSVKSDSHAWFTGFAPVEDPEIAVTVIIEGAGSGGDYAVPMARRVLDTYFEGR